ncbi:dTMP kinase [Streptomyces hirsutus]
MTPRRAGRGRSGWVRSSQLSEAEVTTKLPQVSVAPGAADETEVLPAVPPPSATEETAVLPAITRDENEVASTRELPRVDLENMPDRRRQRSDWAEETPLDNLPTLADELLGPRDGEPGEPGEPDEGGRGKGKGRRR